MFTFEKLRSECIVLYGAGLMGLGIANVLLDNNVKPVCFCDKNGTGIEPQIKLPIISPQQLKNEYADAVVVISSPIYAYQIEENLKDLGFDENKVFSDLEKLFGGIPDDKYLESWFKQTGYELNLKNPQTFNEKLQWLKLYDRKPVYTTMADKIAAKDFIREKLDSDEYIVPTLGIWNSFDEIDFDSLPEQFVLKCNHDCGGVVIVTDKSRFDKVDARKKLSASLKRNFFWGGREWVYRDIQPRIFAEAFLGENIQDYKYLCFNGSVKSIFTCTERASGLKVTFFDPNWKRLQFVRRYPASSVDVPMPANYSEMYKTAQVLSEETTFLRVDFFEADGRLYVGELTFYPGNGVETFTPVQWDYSLGSWMDLPKRSRK